MKRSLAILGTVLALLTMLPAIGADAQNTSSAGGGGPAGGASSSSLAPIPADACIHDVNTRLASEEREYRMILFGLKKAEDERVGNTRYDRDGIPWIKTRPNEWRSAANPSAAFTDREMQNQMPIEPRKGVFETLGVSTNELVPPLTQSYRALTCRVEEICQALWLSLQSAGLQKNQTFNVDVPGCKPRDVAVLHSCQFAPEQDKPQADQGAKGAVLAHCLSVSGGMLDREADLLRLAVSYDGAYRSLLQFAGNFDQFVSEFRFSLVTPVREAVSLLGQLQRIPCFLAQCDR
jgi:hypothetical protein